MRAGRIGIHLIFFRTRSTLVLIAAGGAGLH
jgi:hypothetical protein